MLILMLCSGKYELPQTYLLNYTMIQIISPIPQEEARAMIREADNNGDGLVDYRGK